MTAFLQELAQENYFCLQGRLKWNKKKESSEVEYVNVD